MSEQRKQGCLGEDISLTPFFGYQLTANHNYWLTIPQATHRRKATQFIPKRIKKLKRIPCSVHPKRTKPKKVHLMGTGALWDLSCILGAFTIFHHLSKRPARSRQRHHKTARSWSPARVLF